ncbi:hypothetical protein SETIT_5G392000v2 [Setaria italica]|uniref:Late embryogenesis abundant protein LEA-2 subgroup domain-containing protein n=2 Tax=Setaria italica TaxID=4555 RepID=A0A368RDI6_SETIT|nr:NDR1/HIN1-like protein 3 [Setaria italica]RCV28269.1 hypothetical protein SETIT_5G392000v2 [Setaria italica]
MAMASNEHKIDHLDQPIPPPAAPDAGSGGVVPPARRRDAYALACRALTLVLIALGVVALLLWLVYQPSSLKAYADSAQLTRFDLAGDNNGARLRFDLTVGVSIRNPNRRQAVLYRRLEAVALYGGERLGRAADLPRMRQPRKSTVEVRTGFRGEGAAAVSPAAAALFRREKEEWFFGIGVKLHSRVRLKVAVVDSVEYRPDVDCYIRVPDPSNTTAVAQGFTPTQCHVDDFS